MSIYDDYADFNGSVVGPDNTESTLGPKIAHVFMIVCVSIVFLVIGSCTVGLFIGR